MPTSFHRKPKTENRKPNELPLVAIIGRANVGKSTLFNRLIRSSQALVADQPGVTRDRHYGRATWDDHPFLLVDTGGLLGADDDLRELVRRQAEAAVAEADAILLVMDGKVGPQIDDDSVVAYLRQTAKPVLLVINKIDHLGREALLPEFYRFGLTPLYPVSAIQGLGMGSLLEDLIQLLPPPREVPELAGGIRIAVLGRPNVGKSSFINRLLGEDRLIVSAQPGTTRDAIDTSLTWQGKDYLLIDTAGIRRRSHVEPGVERYMVLKALKALGRADLVLLMLDAQEGITQQDQRLAALIAEDGKGCLVLVNKWDLVAAQPGRAQEIVRQVEAGLVGMAYAPVLQVSVKTGYHLNQVFPLADRIYEEMGRRVGTGELNTILQQIVQQTPPPRFRDRPVKFYYLTQAEVHPPTFIAFVNQPAGVKDSYRRYLIKQLRARLNIPHAPLRLFFKGRQRRGSGPTRRREAKKSS